ncbi:LOW QUALITY PROTEIN: dynein heavy chain domain-containing protein 1 [Gastrophryne carolinensis]
MEEPTRSQVTRLPPLPRNNLQPLTGSGTRSVQSSSSVRGPLSPGTRSVQSSSSVRGPSESLCRLLGLPPCRGPLSRGDVQRVALAVTRFVSRAPQGLDLRWWQQLVEVLRLLRPLQDSLRCERAVLLPALERVHREYERHRGDLGNLDLPCALRAAFPLDDSPLFTLPRDLEQHYLPRPRPILLRHLPLYLASVGAELAGYESIWRHSHGGTYLALQTDVPIEIIPDPDRSVPAPPPPPPPAPQRSLRHRSSAAMFDDITGFQAAELLAQYRHLGGVVFLYLNRLHGMRDCYYDLRVAPPPDLHPEHFVFSPFGVLHVDPPGASETLELGAWHREAVLCRAVRGIPYFRHFLQRRAVRRWRQNVRRIRFLRTREVIGQSLVHNVPHYMAALQHIQRLLLELAETRWLPSASPGPASIHQMEETLGEVRTGGGMALENLLTLTAQILDLVREDTYTLLSSTQKDAQVPPPRNRPASRGRQQQVESWLSRLGNLASLAGHMICQNLHAIIQHNSRTFVYDVIQQRSPAPAEPFLQVDLKFGDDGDLILSPPNHQIQQSFSHALTAIIGSALQVSVQFLQSQGSRSPEAAMMNAAEPGCPPLPPLGESRLRAETCSPAPPPATCRDMRKEGELRLEGRLQRSHYLPLCLTYLPHLLHSDPSISQARDTLQRLLQVSLQEVERFSEEHAWLGEIRRYVRCWSPRVLEQLRGKSSRDYEDLILRLQSWEQRVHGVSEFISTPVLRVSCSSIRAQTAPGLAAITQDIVTLLTSEVSRRSRDLILELGQVLEILRGVTTDIPAFSRCAHKVAEYTDKRGALQQGVEYTRSLQDVIRMNFRQLTAEEQSLDDQLRDTWDAFQHHLRTCGDFLSAHLTSMSDSLERTFLARRREAESIIAAGSAPRYLDPEQNAALVLRDLGELHLNLRSHLAQLRDLSQSRRILQGKSFDVSEVSGGEQRLQGRQEVWKLLSRSREQISAWKLRPFLKVNIELMREKLCRWGRSLQDLGMLLSEADPVVCSGRSLLQDFSQHLPLLQSLLSPAMTPQHWAAIFTVMGATFPGLEELTLLQLLSCPLAQHQEQIQKITRRAHAEFSMEMDLKQIQTFWKEKSFTLVPFLLCVAAQDPAPDPSKRPPSGRFRKLQSGLCTRDSGTFLLTAMALDLWISFQQRWVFLMKVQHEMETPLPHAPTVEQLQSLSQAYGAFLLATLEDPRVLSILTPGRRREPHLYGSALCSAFRAGIRVMDDVIGQMEDVLYSYRCAFPRLFFLSDGDLLRVLAASPEPAERLTCALLCFPHLSDVTFQPQSPPASGFYLHSGCALTTGATGSFRETLDFTPPIPWTPRTVPWLSELEERLRDSVRGRVQRCLSDARGIGGVARWIERGLTYPWQCLRVTEEVLWCQDMERSLQANQKSSLQHRDKIERLAERLQSHATLPRGQQALLSAWLALAIQQQERTQSLLEAPGPALDSFLWVTMMKYRVQQAPDRPEMAEQAPDRPEMVQQAPDRPEMAQQAPDRPEMAQKASDRPEIAQQAPDRPQMAQQAPDRPEMAQQVPDRPEMAQQAPDRPEMARQAPDRPEMAQQASDRPEIAQQAPDRPEMVQQVPDRPEMAQQVPDRPEMAQQAPDRPEMVQQVPDRPEMAQQVPDRPEMAQQAPDRPEMAQQAPDRPEMARQAPDRPEIVQQAPDRPEMVQQAPDRPEMVQQAPDRPEIAQQAPDRPEMAPPVPLLCYVDVLGYHLPYGWEYVGLDSSMADLPLTDRTTLGLMLALQQYQCGAVIGRDEGSRVQAPMALGAAVGRRVEVLNCWAGLSLGQLTSHLQGALRTGAWLVLGGVHQLPSIIQAGLGELLLEVQSCCREALGKGKSAGKAPGRLQLEGRTVPIAPGYGCFMTLPDVSASRPLPHKLRLLLRPVSLRTPDLRASAELALLAAGFQGHSYLAQKMARFFQLAQECGAITTADSSLLLRTIIQCATTILKNSLRGNGKSQGLPSKTDPDIAGPRSNHSMVRTNLLEEKSVMAALAMSAIGTGASASEIGHLQDILRGIFPTYVSPSFTRDPDPVLRGAIAQDLQESGLEVHPDLSNSIAQLFQALQCGSGVLLTGPAGAGKTTCWKVLHRALNRLAGNPEPLIGQTSDRHPGPIQVVHLFPNSVSLEEFLGGGDDTAAIFSSVLRRAGGGALAQKWVILDGTPALEWMEPVSCFFSPHPVLTLAGGERLVLDSATKLVFEMSDMSTLSPAMAVSCSLVPCAGQETWRPIIRAFTSNMLLKYKITWSTRHSLQSLSDSLIPRILCFLEHCTPALHPHMSQATARGVQEVSSFCAIFQALLDQHLLKDPDPTSSENHMAPMASDTSIERLPPSRNHPEVSEPASDCPAFLSTGSPISLYNTGGPSHQRAHTYFLYAFIWGFGGHLHPRHRLEFGKFFRESLSHFGIRDEVPPEVSVFDVMPDGDGGALVPCVRAGFPQSEGLLYALRSLALSGHPVLMVGSPGSGKTNLMQSAIPHGSSLVRVPFYSALKASALRSLLRSRHEAPPPGGLKRARPLHTRHVFIFDDLHAATADAGSQTHPALETVRHIVWDPSSCVTGSFLAAASPPEHGARPLPPRLTRLFSVLVLAPFGPDRLLSLFTARFSSWLKKSLPRQQAEELGEALALASVRLYHKTLQTLPPRYSFSLHALHQVLRSMVALCPSPGPHLPALPSASAPAAVLTRHGVVLLWAHEVLRTFTDGLEDLRDRESVRDLLKDSMREIFYSAPVNTAQGASPSNTTQGASPSNKAQGASPSNKAQGASPSNTTEGASASNTTEGASPSNTTEGASASTANVTVPKTPMTLVKVTEGASPSTANVTVPMPQMTPVNTAKEEFPSTNNANVPMPRMTPVNMTNGASPSTADVTVPMPQVTPVNTAQGASPSTADANVPMPQVTPVNTTQGASPSTANVPMPQVTPVNMTQGASPSTANVPMPQVTPVNMTQGASPSTANVPMPQVTPVNTTQGASPSTANVPMPQVTPVNMTQGASTANVPMPQVTSVNATEGSSPSTAKANVPMPLSPVSQSEEKATDQVTNPEAPGVTNMYVSTEMESLSFASTPLPQEKEGILPSELIPSDDHIASLHFSRERPPRVTDRADCLSYRERPLSSSLVLQTGNLTLCPASQQHLTRLTRVLLVPGGHIILLSHHPGTGRRSLVRLAARVTQCTLLELCGTESEGERHALLREACRLAGVLGIGTAILVDYCAPQEALMELEVLIREGTFLGLYSAEQEEVLLQAMAQVERSRNRATSRKALQERFIAQVRDNLHIIFIQRGVTPPPCMGPYCAMDLYQPWNRASLQAVAEQLLQDVPGSCTSAVSLPRVMSLIHVSAQSYCHRMWPTLPLTSPGTFTTFIRIFLSFLSHRKGSILKDMERLQLAICRVDEISAEREKWAQEAEVLSRSLQVATQEAERWRAELEETGNAEQQLRSECEELERAQEQVRGQVGTLQGRRREALEEACVQWSQVQRQLKVADVEELRSYRAPPDAVVMVTDVLCIVFGRRPGWESARLLLAQEDFYEELQFYDGHRMPDAVFSSLTQAVSRSEFRAPCIRPASAAAASLCDWLCGLQRFCSALRRLDGDKGLLSRAEAQHVKGAERMAECRLQQEQLRIMGEQRTRNLQLSRNREEELRGRVTQCQERLGLLQEYEEGAGPYRAAWRSALESLQKKLQTLVPDSLLASASICYLGSLPWPRCAALVGRWRRLCDGEEVPLDPDDVRDVLHPAAPAESSASLLLEILGGPADKMEWRGMGLPEDPETQTRAALLRAAAQHTPLPLLIIDPDNVAKRWLPALLGVREKGGAVLITDVEKDFTSMDVVQHFLLQPDQHLQPGATPEYGAALRDPILGATPEYGAALRDPILGATPEYGAPLRDPILGATPEYGAPLCDPILGATPEYGAPLCDPILGATPEYGAALRDPILGATPEYGAPLREPILGATPEYGAPLREPILGATPEYGAPLHGPILLCTSLPLGEFVEGCGTGAMKRVIVADLSLAPAALQEELLCDTLRIKDPRLLDERRRLRDSQLQLAEDLQRVQDALLDDVIAELRPLHHRRNFLRDVLACKERRSRLQESLADVELLQGRVQENMARYHCAAQRGRALYSRLQEISRLSPQYRFPASAILCWARQALRGSERGVALEEVLVGGVLRHALAALTEDHRLVLRLLMAVGQPPPLEWFSFLGLVHRAAPEAASSCIQRPYWLDTSAWEELGHLERMVCFRGIRSSLSAQAQQWREYFTLRSTVIGPPPCSSFAHLTLFQTAILWRIVRPESLGLVLTHLTSCILGPEPAEPMAGDRIMTFYDAHSPVLIPLPRHAPVPYHPRDFILQLAQRVGKEVKEITWRASLPESHAHSVLFRSRQEGHWVLLHWHPQLAPLLEEVAGDVIYGGHIVDDGDARDVMAVAQQCRQDEGRRPARLSRLFSPLLAGIAGCGMPDARRLLRALLSWREPGALGLSEGLQAARMEVLGGRVLSALLLSQDVWTAGAEPRSLRPPMVREEPVSYCLALLRDLYTELDAPPAAQDWTTCHMSNMAPPIGEQDRTTDHMTSMVPPRGEQDRTTDHMTNMVPPRGGLDRTTDHMTSMVPPRGEQDRTTDHMTNMVPPRGGLDRTTDHMTSMAPPRGELDRTTDHMTNMVPPSSAMDQSASRKRPGPIRSFVQEEWSLLRGLVHQAMGELMEAESGCRCPRCQEVQDWLSEGQVPPWWDVYPGMPPPVTPHTWISELRTRQVLLSGYLSAPHGATYNLSAFRNPAHLLHALLLDQSLRDRQELHTYHLHVQVRDRGTPPRVTGSQGHPAGPRVTLGGVQLRHALWDTRLCALQETLSPRLCPLPELHLTADQAPPPATPTYLCPLYIGHAQHQQRPLMLIPLPTNLPPSVWRLRGVHALSLLAPPPGSRNRPL